MASSALTLSPMPPLHFRDCADADAAVDVLVALDDLVAVVFLFQANPRIGFLLSQFYSPPHKKTFIKNILYKRLYSSFRPSVGP